MRDEYSGSSEEVHVFEEGFTFVLC